ncbi:biotin transporter BioY [Bdellovibrio bacteriovorus]|uniref:biotin transporter BioY n=1 Tax=Bdellovibrio bacteriovorus TaxID=959 RepID=UPI0002EC9AA8|nr:biotin transporter BioY [Bdellovibrio bacteriovorus]
MTKLHSMALLPQISSKLFTNPTTAAITSTVAGSVLLALIAQINIHLPFTPVPITGQTFGVALLSLLWGRKLATASMALYLVEGAAGLPVFAQGKAFLTMGPTVGYLLGMLLATWFVGGMADRGYTKTFKGALASAYLGSLLVFTVGALGLSFFVPFNQLLALGVLPFLPGDLLKNTLAAATASALSRRGTSD